eukprot:9477696-Pyramimonas_sp.AAC.1
MRQDAGAPRGTSASHKRNYQRGWGTLKEPSGLRTGAQGGKTQDLRVRPVRAWRHGGGFIILGASTQIS